MNKLLFQQNILVLLCFISGIQIASSQPVNDEPCNAIAITAASPCWFNTYSTTGATASTGITAPSCGSYAGGDVWFKVTVPPDGVLNFYTQEGEITDAAIELYSGSCNALTYLECIDGYSYSSMPLLNVRDLIPGSTIWVRFWANENSQSGTFDMCITIPSIPQGCADANPFCTGTIYTFPAATNVPDAGQLACLGSSPNPSWYYLNIETSGDIALDISMVDSFGMGQDVDFICYGPYNSLDSACTNQTGSCTEYTSNPISGNVGCIDNVVDCSYSSSATEICGIQGAIAGEWYMLLLTNFSQVEAEITFSQGNTGALGAGSTNCQILCSMNSITATPGLCDISDYTYTTSGIINYTNPPSAGTLMITNTCNGITQFIDAPFPDNTTTYTLTGLPSDGQDCSITATFSERPSCIISTTLTAPPSCDTICTIQSISATPSACAIETNNHFASGSITFKNAPVSGTLTISNSCGSTQTINAPFASPINYTLNNIPSNGTSCTIDAVFSADNSCVLTQDYTAPDACSLCPITAENNGALCVGETLNLTTTFVQDATYNWTGPNGFTSTLQNPTITNVTSTMAGSYVVTINIPSPTCNSAASTLVEINQVPLTTVNSPSVCENNSVRLVAMGADTYAWSTSSDLDATTSATVNASPTTNSSYTVTGTNTCGSSTAVANVTINTLPTVSVNSETICEGTSTTLIATATNTDSFLWTPSTKLNTTTSSTVTASPTSSITYTVTATNTCGNRSAVSIVTVNPLPILTTSPSAIICPGESTILTASGANTYTWTPTGSINVSTGASVIASPTINTTYTVTGSNNCGNKQATSIVAIELPSVVTVNSATVCAGTSATLLAQGANTYSWSPSTNLNTTTGNTVIASPLSPTTYSVVGTDGCGSNIAEAEISIFPAPNATISEALGGCETLETFFTGTNGKPPYIFTYKINGILQASLTSSDSTNEAKLYRANVTRGAYNISLVSVTDANECATTTTNENILANVYQKPSASFTVNPNQTSLLDPSIMVFNASLGGKSWFWNFDDGFISQEQNPPLHTYKDTGVYVIRLIATAQYGCADTTSQTVIINPLFVLYIPNAFTPYGNDDSNNTFSPKGEGLLSYTMDIYDRWGEAIFHTTDINNGWNGSVNNNNNVTAQIGSYIYVINVRSANYGHDYTYRGQVNLLK